ncbi:MAG TPA: spore coat protein CotJB [Clostridium sp.]|jgi:spore coat protein JB|nr:spore coat protein CotJB [Clostridia bacterium]HCW05672.1 spore coat protein CotJB [Clostridium sp.]
MSDDKNKFKLLEQIMSIDFMIVDLNLYLNTHPMDKEAIAKHNSFTMQSKMLKESYERLYGPLTQGSASAYPWQWIKEPWPWEYEANPRLSGEGK